MDRREAVSYREMMSPTKGKESPCQVQALDRAVIILDTLERRTTYLRPAAAFITGQTPSSVSGVLTMV
jgi:hypothetical protein